MDASVTLMTLPAGLVMDYAGSTAPNGWLACNGQAISRTTYANLFASIGTTYGVGDGSTTFNLPDLRGRTTIGVGQGSGLSNRTIGQSLGEENHLLTEAEMPSHTHIQNAHSHTYSLGSGAAGGNPGSGTGVASNTYGTSSTTATNQNTGGGQTHNNMQPSLVMNKIIKF